MRLNALKRQLLTTVQPQQHKNDSEDIEKKWQGNWFQVTKSQNILGRKGLWHYSGVWSSAVGPTVGRRFRTLIFAGYWLADDKGEPNSNLSPPHFFLCAAVQR